MLGRDPALAVAAMLPCPQTGLSGWVVMSRVASLERRPLAFVVVAAQQVKSLQHRFFGTVGLYPGTDLL